MKLICLPYAGGSAVMFNEWKKSSNHEIVDLEYAGRGRKVKEKFYQNINNAVEDLYSQIEDKISNESVAIFGYSLGSRLAYNLALKIKKERKDIKIAHIFFTAADAPNILEKRKYSELSEKELIKCVLGLGGTNSAIFESKATRDYFLPIIRSDFRLAENFQNDSMEKLDCDISILYGTKDTEIFSDKLSEWNNCTEKKCKFYEFEGGHFFINEYQEIIIKIINKILMIQRNIGDDNYRYIL